MIPHSSSGNPKLGPFSELLNATNGLQIGEKQAYELQHEDIQQQELSASALSIPTGMKNMTRPDCRYKT
jgi:hypothetical protein